MKSLPLPTLMSLSIAVAAVANVGCAGHENRVQGALEALDRGAPAQAISGLNAELGVRKATEVPSLRQDNPLLLLDRGTVLLSMGRNRDSARDLGFADKGLDVLDLSRTKGDELARYLFTDDAGAYRAPAHEKLLLNTLNMINYLALHDLSGARVEARRLAVMQSFLKRRETETKLLGIGSYLAGFTFEQSGRRDEALLHYEEALQFASYSSLRAPLHALTHDEPKSPAIDALLKDDEETVRPSDTTTGEIVVVVGYGRVAQKVPMRIPVGQALQLVGALMNPGDRAQAEQFAARGLVTWVNYPTLGPQRTGYAKPTFAIDGHAEALETPLDVDAEMRREWRSHEPTIVLSALTRLVSRVAAGGAAEAGTSAALRSTSSDQANAGSSGQNAANALGLLVGLATTATMSAVDTPDTRSWATLPARLTVGRVRVAAGEHTVTLSTRGTQKSVKVNVEAGGWAFVPMLVLR